MASETHGVYAALTAAIADTAEGIKKNKTAGSGQFSYKFRGVDDVLNFLSPVLARHKLAVVPHKVLAFEQTERRSIKKGYNKGDPDIEVILYCSRLRQAWRLYHADGSYVEGENEVENANGQDKGPNACVSVSFKYFCLMTFCVPIDDKSVEDETTETHHTPAPPRAPAQRQQTPPAPAPPSPPPAAAGPNYTWAFRSTRGDANGKGARTEKHEGHDIRDEKLVLDSTLTTYLGRLTSWYDGRPNDRARIQPYIDAAEIEILRRREAQARAAGADPKTGEVGGDDIPF